MSAEQRGHAGERELIYCELLVAQRVRDRFIVAGTQPDNVRIEERHDWEGQYWVVIVR